MGKTFRPYEPRQVHLLPASPHDWLPEDHLAYFLLDVVGELDLRPICAHYDRELRGLRPSQSDCRARLRTAQAGSCPKLTTSCASTRCPTIGYSRA